MRNFFLDNPFRVTEGNYVANLANLAVWIVLAWLAWRWFRNRN